MVQFSEVPVIGRSQLLRVRSRVSQIKAELATSVRYPSRLHDGFVASHVINHAHKSVPTKDASYPVSPNALSKALDVPMNCIMAILHGQ